MRRARRGFTLIELLAVLLIIGLIAGLVLPNLSLRSDRVVLGAAEDLASDLAFARQRAVATGRAHRLHLDLDAAAWWIEEWPEEPPPSAAGADPDRSPEVQLSAPSASVLDFRPLATRFGRPRVLPQGVEFASVETLAAGTQNAGEVGVVFEGDGSAEAAVFVLANEEGEQAELQLSPLADQIRIRRGD